MVSCLDSTRPSGVQIPACPSQVNPPASVTVTFPDPGARRGSRGDRCGRRTDWCLQAAYQMGNSGRPLTISMVFTLTVVTRFTRSRM